MEIHQQTKTWMLALLFTLLLTILTGNFKVCMSDIPKICPLDVLIYSILVTFRAMLFRNRCRDLYVPGDIRELAKAVRQKQKQWGKCIMG